MATDTQTTPATRLRPYRLSVRQYLKMIDAGVFPEHAHVELLGGLLICNPDKHRPRFRNRLEADTIGGPPGVPMTKGGLHNYSTLALSSRFRRMLDDNWLISEEKSLFLGPASRPEPDLAILRGPVELYKNRDPAAPDVALIVEMAESSYRYDRGHKWRRYAAALIPVYWIVNLQKRQVEVYRDPAVIEGKGQYRTSEVYGEDAAVPVLIAGAEVGRVAVRDILP